MPVQVFCQWFKYIKTLKQEILANAKLSARQQCTYEGP